MDTFRAVLLMSMIALFAVPTGIQHNYKPPDGCVPNEITAVRIAEAVLLPIYGEKQIKGEMPLSATLQGSVWHVTGSMPSAYDVGGVAEVEISKETGEIFRVTHGK